jgi:hypothetical protein
MKSETEEPYSEAETERRFKSALKRMLNTPHKPHAKTEAKAKAKKVKPRDRAKP